MNTISIALKIRAKNGVLQKFIDEKGWTQSDFARALNVSSTRVADWFNMKDVPRSDDMILKICKLVDKAPDEIFPDIFKNQHFKKISKVRTLFKDVDPDEFLLMNDMPINQLTYSLPDNQFEFEKNMDVILKTLTEREESIIRDHFFNGKTLEEVGDGLGIGRERTRKIETSALRKLRHPARARRIDPDLYADREQRQKEIAIVLDTPDEDMIVFGEIRQPARHELWSWDDWPLFKKRDRIKKLIKKQ
jgi:RNA polymerase sigma factor (sigma-70 family)